MLESFKLTLTKWIPPGLYDWCYGIRMPKTQKFWRGTDVSAPHREKNYFNKLGLRPVTVTRQDDSRNCGILNKKCELNIENTQHGDAVQFAVCSVDKHSRNHVARFKIGDTEIIQSGINGLQWFDIRMDLIDGASSITVHSENELYISYPRVVSTDNTLTDSKHIIVLVLDGLAPELLDDLTGQEGEKDFAPNINRYFSDGYSAYNSFSSAEWTMPTTASYFTGLYTSRHGFFHPTRKCQMATDKKLLAEYFQDAGYHTLCMSTANRLTPAYGCHRGFDRFIYHWPYKGHTQKDYDPSVWISELTGHLDSHKSDKTFSYVHLPDTHPAWQIPPLTRSFNLQRRGSSVGLDLMQLHGHRNANEQATNINKVRLHELDRMLGELFSYIDNNISNRTSIVLTTDHGTPWKYYRRKINKEEPTLVFDRISTFIKIRDNNIKKKRSYKGLVNSSIDLMPTLLAMANLEMPDNIDGANLLSSEYNRDHVISESIYNGIYEICASDGKKSYIRKYNIDDSKMFLLGGLIYEASFDARTRDYGRLFDVNPAHLIQNADLHIKKTGLDKK